MYKIGKYTASGIFCEVNISYRCFVRVGPVVCFRSAVLVVVNLRLHLLF